MAIFMLAGALWMAINPRWVIDICQGLQDGLTRLAPGSTKFARPAGPLPDDRRTRMGIRLFGALLAAVAAAHLFEALVWMLAHYR